MAYYGLTCSSAAQPSWHLRNVRRHLPDLRFALMDDAGNPVTAQDWRGDIVLLYFGFTGCSAQCPVTMARLSSLLQRLDTDKVKMRVLFVSVDPVHDTPQTLRHYLSNFDARHMTGLTGSEEEIQTLARRTRAAYRPYATDSNIPHSDAVYVFDAQGRARLLLTAQDTDADALADLRRIAHDAR